MTCWTKDHKGRILKRIGNNAICHFVGIDLSRGRTTPVDVGDIRHSDLLIAYNPELDLYFVWNSYIHRPMLKGQAKHTFAVRPKYTRRYDRNTIDGMEAIYRPLQGDTPHNEKLLIIEPSYMPLFCANPFVYLAPDAEDEDYKSATLFAHPNHPEPYIYEANCDPVVAKYLVRERISCSRIKRDAEFRRKVFSQYIVPHCIICGASNVKILEAAHIIAVSDNGADVPDNGVCLCRNHHRLWDEGLLEINLDDGTYLAKDSAVAEWMHIDAEVPMRLV